MKKHRFSVFKAKDLYKAIDKAYVEMASAMNSYYDNLIKANLYVWHGGKTATKQYQLLKTNYENNVKYMVRLNNAKEKLKKYVNKASKL